MDKITEAQRILQSCIGTYGVHADTSRYKYQCWTRDLALAVQPVLHFAEGGDKAGYNHLATLAKIQRSDGKIPILFLDGYKGQSHFLWTKIKKSIRDRKLSFMLQRYLQGKLGDLTPGTRDSELMFLYALSKCDTITKASFAGPAKKAIWYIETNLLDDNGMLCGCDWRDTMHVELKDKPLLSNNSILYSVWNSFRYQDRATRLKQRLASRWEHGVPVDYPGANRFDPLGGALAILNRVVDRIHFDQMVRCFRSVDSKHGVTIKCRHNPQNEKEAAVIDRTDGVVVWPFIVGFTILALRHMNTKMSLAMAVEQEIKLMDLYGFREWYDPATGQGYGAQEQLWSAAMTLRVYENQKPSKGFRGC